MAEIKFSTSKCQSCSKDFVISEQESNFYLKFGLPSPNECPLCRKEKREKWMTTAKYLDVNCISCGKDLITSYTSTEGRPTVCFNCRKEYKERNPEISMEYTEGNFLKNLTDLIKTVPIATKEINYSPSHAENSYRSNEISFSKNSFHSYDLSKCFDSVDIQHAISCTNSVGLTFCNRCENSLECIHSSGLYNCAYCTDSRDCKNSYFLDNCRGCSDCYGSSGLRNKRYYIFNKKYSEKDYKNEITNLLSRSVTEQKKKVEEVFRDVPIPERQQVGNCEDCHYGTNIESSTSCYYAINCRYNENCGYIWHCESNSNCWDLSISRRCEDSYMIADCSYSNKLFFSTDCYESTDCWYSYSLYKCSDCFGCISLPPESRYMILNKQYTKDEYYLLVSKIKKELNITL